MGNLTGQVHNVHLREVKGELGCEIQVVASRFIIKGESLQLDRRLDKDPEPSGSDAEPTTQKKVRITYLSTEDTSSGSDSEEETPCTEPWEGITQELGSVPSHLKIHASWIEEWKSSSIGSDKWLTALQTREMGEFKTETLLPFGEGLPGTFLNVESMDLWLLQLAHKHSLNYGRSYAGRKGSPKEHLGGQVWICPTDLSRDLSNPGAYSYDLTKWNKALRHHQIHRRVIKPSTSTRRSKRVFRSLLFPIFLPPESQNWKGGRMGIGHWITIHLNIKRKKLIIWDSLQKSYADPGKIETIAKKILCLWDDLCILGENKSAGAQYWPIEYGNKKDVQENGIDCGVFALHAIEAIARHSIPCLRQEMANKARLTMLRDLHCLTKPVVTNTPLRDRVGHQRLTERDATLRTPRRRMPANWPTANSVPFGRRGVNQHFLEIHREQGCNLFIATKLMVNDGATRSSAAFHSERDFVEDVWEEAQRDETQWELAEIIPLEAECLTYLQIQMDPCPLRPALIEVAAPLILRASENFWRSELGHTLNPDLTLHLSNADDKDRIRIRVIATNITSRSGPRMLAVVTRWWNEIEQQRALEPSISESTEWYLDNSAYPARRETVLPILQHNDNNKPILLSGPNSLLAAKVCIWTPPSRPQLRPLPSGRNWNQQGIRDRSQDLRRDRQPSRKKIAEVHWDNPSGAWEEDYDSDLPIKIASWNAGIGGLHSDMVLKDIVEWMNTEQIAILHIQEARIVRKDLRRLRRRLHHHGPELGMLVHCHTSFNEDSRRESNNRPPAVITLYRKEIRHWVRPISCSIPNTTALQGRIL